MLEEIKVYTDCLNAENRGDLVRCSDCGECESENLMRYDENRPVWTIDVLEEAGFIVVEISKIKYSSR